ncbi:hypothetical protein EYC80_009943 [Monilinia laxa]|uniref:Uncharacterized protein n=2 Tax=Monilinia TaxID=38447 RepID=A0A5N6JR49_MONLA|nr:hypothetical protein EYC80_009943 [Monilinia laxa]
MHLRSIIDILAPTPLTQNSIDHHLSPYPTIISPPNPSLFPATMDDSYQVPTSVPATNPTQAPNPYGASGVLGDGPAIKYLCGDCNASVMLKRGDPIRCKECGHRVLYKERTSRMVQFEAR